MDRQKFLTLAMSLALGCGPKAAPANPDKGSDSTTTTGPTDEAGGGPSEEAIAPAQECIAWDASGECTETDDGEGMYPAEDCIDWDANGECIQFEQANYPDD